jgi:hypothetical protein
MCKILILKSFLTAGNANKFHKTRLWKEKSVEGVKALAPWAQVTLVVIKKGGR